MARILGLVTGLNGTSFDIVMRHIRVHSALSGTARAYGEDGQQTILAAVSRRTNLEFDGYVDGENLPEAGDTLTWKNRAFLIKSAVLTTEKGTFQRCAVKAERADETAVNGLTANTAS